MKITLLFPGQGAQYIGMCKELIENFPTAKYIFSEANEALNFNLQEMIMQGDMKTLTELANAQPAVITASYALYSVLKEETCLEPFNAIGHSLGEISALVAAGGISFRDGVRFVRERGAIMYEAYTENKGRTALILDLEEEIVQKEVDEISDKVGYASICCYNSPKQFVVSGHQEPLNELEKNIKKHKGEFVPFRMMPMKVDAPFHCSLMSFIEDKIESVLEHVTFHPLKWPIVSTVTGLPYESHLDIKNFIKLQLTTPVRWRQAISFLESQDINYAFEIGPQSSMKNLFMENTAKIKCYSFDDVDDKEKIVNFLVCSRLLNYM